MLIPISQIAVINRQRKTINADKLQVLASSIKEIGLLHPIVVRDPFPDETDKLGAARYVLCVGGRRLAAHILLGLDSIEVNRKEDLDSYGAKLAELQENLARENITWQEEVDARAGLHALLLEKNPNHTLAQTEKIINPEGKVSGQISRDLKLKAAMVADPELRKAGSKESAHRLLKHKEHVTERARTVQKSQDSDIHQKLFCADGSTFIRTVATRSIDLVFSDLPYMIDYFENSQSGQNMKAQYDDSPDACKDFIMDILPQMGRVVKPTGWIVLFMCYEWHGWLQTHLQNVCMEHFEYRDHKGKKTCNSTLGDRAADECRFLKVEMPPWIWTRRGAGNHGHWPELHASSRYEMIVVANAGEAKLIRADGYPYENVLDFPSVPSSDRLHAMQKPLDLCREIIKRTTIPGERVLDICMGSGAHLAAAASKGRDFIGCDKNPDNLASAISLVSEHYHRAGETVRQLELVKP